MESISERLSSLMSAKGISQSELAAASNISQGAISKYLAGTQFPKSRELYALSKVLGVTMESWFSDSASVIIPIGNPDWKIRALDAERKLAGLKKAITQLVKEY